MKLMIDSNQFMASKQLATRLQAVPSLKMYGLSLEGDLLNAEGDPKAALIAYKESKAIRPSPSISRRVMSLAAASVEPQRNSADTTKGGQNVGRKALAQDSASNQSGQNQGPADKVASVVKEKLVDWGLASPGQGREGQPSAGQQGQGFGQGRNQLQASFDTGQGQGLVHQGFGGGSGQGGQNVGQQGQPQGQQFQGQQGQSGQGSFQGGNYGQQPQGQSWQQGTGGPNQQFQSGGTQGLQGSSSQQGASTSGSTGEEEEHMDSVRYYQELARQQYATLKQECNTLKKDPNVYEQCQTYAKSVRDEIAGMADQNEDAAQGSNQRGVDRRLHLESYP